MRRYLALAAALILATAPLAHEVVVGDLQFIHPNIPQPAPTAMTAAGYMALVNQGATDDRLIGIETAIAAKAMLHESQLDDSGLSSMRHLDALAIPAGGTVSLAPGGMHIMFMGLTGPLSEGQMVPVTLIFETAGRVEVEFMVDPPGGKGHEHATEAATD